MALKHSYTLLAPVYDSVLSGPIDAYREKYISRITNAINKNILLSGVGTGLDIPYLPEMPVIPVQL
jgi:phosphatidylethanolamine/phosphatidyl-N-methylethanolamine N-methyltransferase